jgi:tetratricopeptide (TPR) repeat protein
MCTRRLRRSLLLLAWNVALGCGTPADRDASALGGDTTAMAELTRVAQAIEAGQGVTPGDIESLTRVQQQYPRAGTVRQTLAAALMSRGDWTATVALLGEVPDSERTAPESADLARAQFQTGHYDEALRALEPLLQSAPSDLELTVLAASADFRLGRNDAAAARLDAVQARLVALGHADGLALRGLVAFHQRDYDNAADVLGQALRLRPDHVAAHNTLARLHAERGERREAEVHLQAAQAALDQVAAAERQAGSTVQYVIELQDGWKAKNSLLVVDRAERLLPGAGTEQRVVLYQYLVEAYRFLGRPQDAQAAQAALRRLQP